MPLPSLFKRKDKPAVAAKAAPSASLAEDTGPVQLARSRARRRLIGAVLLLAVGVLVFPLLFETQPRPLPSDIPIELPRREANAQRPPPALPRPPSPAITDLPVEPVADAASAPVVAAAPPAGQVPSAPAKPPESKPADTRSADARPAETRPAETRPPAPKAAAPKVPDPKTADAKAADPKAAEPKPADSRSASTERARAILEARPVAASTASDAEHRGGRFVVQVGAYTDANTLRDVRQKVEKMGLKTYTQTIETDAGKRTRVRVGPFATRSEADSASSKLKGAGLPGNVLVL